ncbi:MAG: DUF488 family protein [Candidatus Acidulodesulfobacterium acidiphilum]|uniref:DUF488 family protein n=1 Tax=Candidatus Acidulodesulfobacterium acidiphilum TaxID=2597224 RepID=A0A520XH51_9DELT|nr:MAG: DUF488 family protein [Candidatus Acidulodesulfobacterium acidiphilum]
MLNIKRIYDEPSDEDGIRILVDRLWPRGISKEKAKIDFWFKDIAPSNELRKSFHEAAINFKEFKAKYLQELSEYNRIHNSSAGQDLDNSIAEILKLLKTGNKNVTLLYGLKNEINNNAAVLKEFILKQAK